MPHARVSFDLYSGFEKKTEFVQRDLEGADHIKVRVEFMREMLDRKGPGSRATNVKSEAIARPASIASGSSIDSLAGECHEFAPGLSRGRRFTSKYVVGLSRSG